MVLFRERLWAAPWLYAVTALVIPATIIVFAPIHPPVGIRWGVLIGVVIYLAILLALIVGSPSLVVTEEEFRAGRASIEREFIGVVEAFSGSEATLQRGQKLDARAWLLMRGALPVVKMPVTDPADPIPYWLVSTRRANELARILNDRKA